MRGRLHDYRLLAPGDRVVTLAPSFGLHEIFPLMMGAMVDKVPVNAALQEFIGGMVGRGRN